MSEPKRVEPIDINSMTTEKWNLFAVEAQVQTFNNGMEAFNNLSQLPYPISLGDGRVLNIRKWAPVANEKVFGGEGRLDILVEGYVSRPILEHDPAKAVATQVTRLGVKGTVGIRICEPKESLAGEPVLVLTRTGVVELIKQLINVLDV